MSSPITGAELAVEGGGINALTIASSSVRVTEAMPEAAPVTSARPYPVATARAHIADGGPSPRLRIHTGQNGRVGAESMEEEELEGSGVVLLC